MVTRKPVGPPLTTGQAVRNNAGGAPANPPYPATPIDSSKFPASVNSIYSPNLDQSPAFDLVEMDEARKKTRRDSDVSSHGTWDSSDGEGERDTPEENDIPQPLRITPSKQRLREEQEHGQAKDELPAVLRPGPANGVPTSSAHSSQIYQEEAQSNPWAQEQAHPQTPNGQYGSNNPYLRSQETGNGQAAWSQQASPAPPTSAPPPPPVELPTVQTPAEEISKLSLHDRSSEPYRTAEILSVPQQGQSPLPPVATQGDGASSANPWSQEQPTAEQKWDDAAAPPPPPPPGPPPAQPHSLMDDDTPMSAPAGQPEPHSAPPVPQSVPAPFAIPAQASAARSTESVPETPGTRARKQRNETYQIKHIRWWDQSYAQDPRFMEGMRQSPILTQNENGPCPLLALVNALVLSTPQNTDTALIETLRTREQVSLGLLLDAVFDELMSGRRGDTAQELPDVSELYSFLLALHTGMNVNPRFVTQDHTPRGSLDGHPPEMDGVHPLHRAQSKAGCFEETKEMRLYSTFNVPLMHGWVPPKDTPAYDAFNRSAQSFEDAQNVQFAESELEDKLRREGLSDGEQQTLQDIHTIKLFFANWPTQLTDYGLQAILKTLRPGQVAILFRNDHFSTVYKEPKHGGLMTLVTDAGYSTHDEIVWESLVDVNGAASEMFSGDFRVVSHDQDARLNQGNSAGGTEGWQTVPASRNRASQALPPARSEQGPLHVTNDTETPPPLPGPRPVSRQPSPAPQTNGSLPHEVARTMSEQEDHDLALALQLQEEEEDRERRANQQRRREQELSEQYISRENEGRPPAIPPRRNGNGRTTSSTTPAPNPRPAITRPDQPFDPDAPPTYEQSSHDRPYREAGATAAPTQGNPLGAYDALRQSQQQTGSVVGGPGPGMMGHNRRQSQPGARIRRRSSQMGAPMPGGFQQGPSGTGMGRGRPAPGTVQEAEDRCSVM